MKGGEKNRVPELERVFIFKPRSGLNMLNQI